MEKYDETDNGWHMVYAGRFSVAMLPRFASLKDFQVVYEKLKLTPCPHCNFVGALILHGSLYGYTEEYENVKVQRARRVICNRRTSKQNGCGRTTSIWNLNVLPHTRLGAKALWYFLTAVCYTKDIAQAWRTLKLSLSLSSGYRLWRRFLRAQSTLRTLLFEFKSPPSIDAEQPYEHVIQHLRAIFPTTPNPIGCFQIETQTPFF